MDTSKDILFTPLQLRNFTVSNRFVRSATYEGWGDPNGVPKPQLADLYCELARGGVGMLITGFVFTSKAGRAMQPAQCGIETNTKVAPWQQIVGRVRKAAPAVKLVMQIAHTGRQTRREATGLPVVGASLRKCTYFRQRVEPLDDESIRTIIAEFADAAYRAKEAGFDGIQIHAAHGYLVHQFLSPWTNTRTDRWSDPNSLLQQVIVAIRRKCGEPFPILVKLSAADDNTPGRRIEDTIRTVKHLEELEVDAVEISYGTMELALNIIRGACPVNVVLEVNPLFNRIPRFLRGIWRTFFMKGYLKKFIPFGENYNVPAAAQIKRETRLPVFAVGGIRSLEGMIACVTTHGLDAISLCRPLICEPDLPSKIRNGASMRSKCTNCNLCTIYCDSSQPLRCYQKKRMKEEG
jgi:2,4-dienoyl-CoA reductase-like NADH-dependent reductase (Old Yellow Enzyme family)